MRFKSKMRGTTRAALGRWVGSRPWIFLVAGLFGCVQSFSPIVSNTVDKDRTFSVVIQNPKAYIGSIVLWGGVIDKVLHGSEETKLIMIQAPLNSKGYPQTSDTEGEFVAHTPRSLDPAIFQRGTKITLAGEIDGVEEKEFGPEEYPRPLVRVIEIHAWTERIWGVFPVTRKGWEIDELGPGPSPVEVPQADQTNPYP